MEHDKLIKLLNLTTSDYDGEALNSIRFANTLLKSKGMTWDDVFNKVPQLSIGNLGKEIEIGILKDENAQLIRELKNMKGARAISISDKIRACLQDQPYSKFLLSISKSYPKYGRLTPKQLEVLNQIYDGVR